MGQVFRNGNILPLPLFTTSNPSFHVCWGGGPSEGITRGMSRELGPPESPFKAPWAPVEGRLDVLA